MNAILPDLSRRGFLVTVSATGALFALGQPAQAADGFAPTI